MHFSSPKISKIKNVYIIVTNPFQNISIFSTSEKMLIQWKKNKSLIEKHNTKEILISQNHIAIFEEFSYQIIPAIHSTTI